MAKKATKQSRSYRLYPKEIAMLKVLCHNYDENESNVIRKLIRERHDSLVWRRKKENE